MSARLGKPAAGYPFAVWMTWVSGYLTDEDRFHAMSDEGRAYLVKLHKSGTNPRDVVGLFAQRRAEFRTYQAGRVSPGAVGRVQPALGRWLKETRNDRKITVRELGKAIGLDYSALSRIERGQRNPSFTNWLDLCDVLEVRWFGSAYLFFHLAQDEKTNGITGSV